MNDKLKGILVPFLIGMLLSSIGSSYRKSQEIKRQEQVIVQLENKIIELEEE